MVDLLLLTLSYPWRNQTLEEKMVCTILLLANISFNKLVVVNFQMIVKIVTVGSVLVSKWITNITKIIWSSGLPLNNAYWFLTHAWALAFGNCFEVVRIALTSAIDETFAGMCAGVVIIPRNPCHAKSFLGRQITYL